MGIVFTGKQWIFTVGLLGLFCLIGGWPFPIQAQSPLTVFVSVLPQKYFVERVGGDRVDVFVMVGPGKSPATYEPTPRQMAKLADARVYFRIGVPFEDVWMKRISAANPAMKVVDMRKDIALREMEAHTHDDEHKVEYARQADQENQYRGKDPHVWTDPLRVKVMAGQIKETLVELDPVHRQDFQANYEGFAKDLEHLDRDIRQMLKNKKERRFMVFHPAWGYFAQRYHLQQIPVETEGKEPGARQLAELIDFAKANDIHVIFVQKQFSRRNAETIARSIDGRVVSVDPLAVNYLENLRSVAGTFAEALH
jgi:zinc transport system substrate-binding protein